MLRVRPVADRPASYGGPMGLPRLVTALAGPGAFAAGAFVGARVVPDYSPRDEPISALAAHGMASARVMVAGFVGLAAGTVAFARAVRGAPLAPAPVPALLTAAGLAVGGAGLARCSDRSCPTRALGDTDVRPTDDLHAAFSGVTFALWIAVPLVAARRAHDASPAARALSGALGLSTLAALVVGGRMAQRPSAPYSGAAQRVMIASALAWFPLAAVARAGR
jgi:hypothetical protein